jgi:hypothetical protein
MKVIVAATTAAGLATGVLAQMSSSSSTATTTSAPVVANDSSSDNPALKSSHVHTSTMAAKGSNSFTQGQAHERIATAGYTGIGALTKNKDGVWMGQAMQNGKSMMVGLDYKGNVTPR